jgi:hypothetical protein
MIAVDAGQHLAWRTADVVCKTGERMSVKKLLAFFASGMLQ